MPSLRHTRDYSISEAIEGCKAYGVSYREWRRRRRFIASEINTPGTFIDLGCGSGFLILCLELWSGHQLEPYGLDHDVDCIAFARSIFSSKGDHFLCVDFHTFLDSLPCQFPLEFDYVFWNAPNDWPSDRKESFLRSAFLRVAVGGKLIVAIYEENKQNQTEAEFLAEKALLEKKWIEMAVAGFSFDRVVRNPEGTNHSIGIRQRL